MKSTILLIILETLLSLSECNVEDCRTGYHGYQLLRLTLKTDRQYQIVRRLRDDPEIDFWRSGQEGTLDLLAKPERVSDISQLLWNSGISHASLIPDVQRRIDEIRVLDASAKLRTLKSRDLEPGDNFNRYLKLDEINSFMVQMSTTWPTRAKVFSIGQSYEGRDLNVIKISSDDVHDCDKPTIWIDGGIHAREWVSPAAALFCAYSFLLRYGEDPYVSRVLDGCNVYIMPVANPDGYVYSHECDRLWRKSRSNTSIPGEIGVDLNRNWDFMWGTNGKSSSGPGSETYDGPFPFSEPETVAMAKFIYEIQPICYVTLHSYGQCWMTPWACTTDLPSDNDWLVALSLYGAKVLKSVYGTHYTVGPVSHVIYQASGSSIDWVHKVARVPYACALELRGDQDSPYGFLLPPSQIFETANETWTGLLAVFSELVPNCDRDQ
ncbi:Carboxypeptidase A2 [Halotydeus destructor]|nr:Carboxypeptidase A2 [Halotydeus destructor]